MNDTQPFDYTRVPHAFAHCFNEHCPRAAECLRRLAAQHIPAELPNVTAVNPHSIRSESECPHFLPLQKIRIAWGIKGLFDHLPHKEAVAMRRELIAHFNKTHYYRLQRKEYHLKPEEQEYIRQVFKKHGIETEPVFEYYTEDFRWR